MEPGPEPQNIMSSWSIPNTRAARRLVSNANFLRSDAIHNRRLLGMEVRRRQIASEFQGFEG